MKHDSPTQDDGIVSAKIRGFGHTTYPLKELQEIKKRKAERSSKWRLVQHLRDAMTEEERRQEVERLRQEIEELLAARAAGDSAQKRPSA